MATCIFCPIPHGFVCTTSHGFVCSHHPARIILPSLGFLAGGGEWVYTGFSQFRLLLELQDGLFMFGAIQFQLFRDFRDCLFMIGDFRFLGFFVRVFFI
jgi:hypothetical protein